MRNDDEAVVEEEEVGSDHSVARVRPTVLLIEVIEVRKCQDKQVFEIGGPSCAMIQIGVVLSVRQ